MRKALRTFEHIFVQDPESLALLAGIGIQNTTVNGDTRFDRVSEILSQDNPLNFMEAFKGPSLCVVAGSSWPIDEKIITPYIDSNLHGIKFVIAPHNIHRDHVQHLVKTLRRKTLMYSERQGKDLSDYEVLILDTVGMLSQVYSYADIAYVGGGFGTGLHNTLEPAVYGIPVLIGPKYKGFKEAEDLVDLGGILITENEAAFAQAMEVLVRDTGLRMKTGEINGTYVAKNIGASIRIVDHIRSLCS